jgi:hypothetical protein
MTLDRMTPARATSLLGALAIVLSLSSCGRALPTSPDAGIESARGNASPNTLVVSDGGDDNASGGPGAPDPNFGDGGSNDPVVPVGSGGSSGPSTLGVPPSSYQRAANKLVKPNKEVVIAGGRWTLAFHNGSLAVKKIVSIDQATDGTVRASLSPSGTTFAVPVDLTVDYSGSHMDPSAPGYVAGTAPVLYRWDGVGRRWMTLAATNDPVHHLLHASVTQLGAIGVGNGLGW